MDRIVMLLKESGFVNSATNDVDIYFILLNKEAHLNYLSLIFDLRNSGASVDFDISNKSFKAQLKYANRINARFVCIIGEDEIKNNIGILKNMDTGEQINITLDLNNILNNIK